MKVHTSDIALQRIQETAGYIQREFGKQYRVDFMQKVREVKRLLRHNPYLGPSEPLLADRATTYRSIVVARQNKMVYRITDDRIEIVDFWDVRREPEKQAGNIKR